MREHYVQSCHCMTGEEKGLKEVKKELRLVLKDPYGTLKNNT